MGCIWCGGMAWDGIEEVNEGLGGCFFFGCFDLLRMGFRVLRFFFLGSVLRIDLN